MLLYAALCCSTLLYAALRCSMLALCLAAFLLLCFSASSTLPLPLSTFSLSALLTLLRLASSLQY
jgi:hypothetical protein